MNSILVIGCGKLGSRVANELFDMGYDVSVVDVNANRFSQLSDDFDGNTIEGLPMDTDVLREAGVELCDAVVVTTGDDNLNITVSQIIKKFFNLDNIIVRINDPDRGDVFNNFGLKSICSTKLMSHAIISSLENNEHEVDFSISNANYSFVAIDMPDVFVGEKLSKIELFNDKIVLGILTESGETIIKREKSDCIAKKSDRLLVFKVID